MENIIEVKLQNRTIFPVVNVNNRSYRNIASNNTITQYKGQTGVAISIYNMLDKPS